MLATHGRAAVIALQGGKASEVDLGRMMVKRLSIHGTTLRGRPRHEKEAIVRAAAGFALPRFADGRMRPLVAQRFRLDEAGQAFDFIRNSKPFGKVVLDV